MDARKVAELIAEDIMGRGGGDEFWYMIDEETQEEILEAWTKIIQEKHG